MAEHAHTSVFNAGSQKQDESVDEGPGPTPTVASELAAWLRSLGVEQAFGVDSHHVTWLWPALWKAGIGIRMAATETGAGFMADGCARATGQLGVATIGGGPGLAMMMPALQTAMVERVPLLVIVGQSATTGIPPFQTTGSEGSRDLQMLRGLLESSDAVTRVVAVAGASAVPAAFDFALDALRSGGPAVVAIPVDVQSEPADRHAGASTPPLPRPFTWSWPGGESVAAFQRDTALAKVIPTSIESIDRANTSQPPVAYRDVLVAVAESLPGAQIFVDAGQARHAAHEVLPDLGVAFFDCPRSAPMGWAIAAAVGAGIAQSGRLLRKPGVETPGEMANEGAGPPAGIEDATPVVCVLGDGSALMMGTEFATAMRHQARVTFVTCVNHVWGGPFLRHQGMPYGDLAHLPTVDWIAFAGSLGLPVSWAVTTAELEETLRTKRPEAGPHLVLVPTPAVDNALRVPYSAATCRTGE